MKKAAIRALKTSIRTLNNPKCWFLTDADDVSGSPMCICFFVTGRIGQIANALVFQQFDSSKDVSTFARF